MKIKFNSLKTRLIIVLLLMVILPVITTDWLASGAMFDAIRSERIKAVGRIANAKHEQLAMVLTRANARAELFLSSLSKQCGGNAAKLNSVCATDLMRAYQAAEGAIGANLHRKGGGDSLTIGTSAIQNEEPVTFQTGQLAKFSSTGPQSNHSYFVSVAEESTGLRLSITYPSSVLEAVFNPPPADLGSSGETFLADGEGYFVTQHRYTSTQGHGIPISAPPMQSCLRGQSREVLDLDYRDVAIIHGFRFIPEFGSACIMAHVTQEEAFAPLKLLKQQIIFATLLFCVILIIMIIYLVRNIVKPIDNLTKVAQAIAKGDYKSQAEEAGSDEITELATSFNFMTNRLRATIEAAMDAVVQMNAEGIIIGWNSQAEKIFGWTSEEAVGQVLHETIIPLQYREAHKQGLKRFLLSGEGPILNSRIEITGLHRDGHEFPVELTVTPIKMAGKYEFSAFIRDITERKQAEQTLTETAENLRIAAIAFEMQAAIVITDLTPKILRVNKAFEEITGYTAAEAVGQNPNILSAPELRKDKAFYEGMWATLLGKGRWSGEVMDRRKNGEAYPKQLMITAVVAPDGAITHYVGSFFDITERKKAEQDIHRLAFYDPLTNLPNRRLLLDRLQQAMAASARSGKYGAILFIDLDSFKVINDTKGHDCGDLLLIEVAQRLQSCVREGDTVARLGGDEFVVMLEDITGDAEHAAVQVEEVGEKILSVLGRLYLIKEHELRSTASIGISLFVDHCIRADELLKYADIAMYQAKTSGQNTLRFFDPDMQAVLEARTAIESDLHRALAERQLILYYQAQVDDAGRIFGAEALVRWIHPQRGMVPPVKFIPIAEESSLILDIGEWVLETACQQIALWSKDEQKCNLKLAVNVSAKQFKLIDFVDRVAAVIKEHRINPSCLKLELTESVVMDDVSDIVTKMHALKALGVQLSLDDFGTGYSSLSYLKLLPLDQLKIDKSFVNDITTDPIDAVMVRTIIDMAHNFRLNVIAEGVETDAQLAFLKEHGCMSYQGYLFSKPVPIEEFEALLKLT